MKKSGSAFIISVTSFAVAVLVGLFIIRDIYFLPSLDTSVHTPEVSIATQPIDKTFKKVQLNKADKEELMRLPGIGEKMAQKILDYRKKNGKFKNVYELMNIDGIGIERFTAIEPYITVGGNK